MNLKISVFVTCVESYVTVPLTFQICYDQTMIVGNPNSKYITVIKKSFSLFVKMSAMEVSSKTGNRLVSLSNILDQKCS